MRWSLARPDVRFPRWGGTKTDTRIAYLSGGQLRVVGGDGKGDRLLDARRGIARPCGGRAAATCSHMRRRDGTIRVVDVDTGAQLERNVPTTFLSQARPAARARLARRGQLRRAGPLARRPLARASAGRTPTSSSSSAARAAEQLRAVSNVSDPVPLALVSYDRGVVLRALIVAALPAPAAAARTLVEGRPIEVVHVAGRARAILVVGCIHGDECEGPK